MVRKKAKSKRITLSKKYKIEKKVKEHHRKERREAKKNPKPTKLRKDPGIPNLWPFKDKLLHQIEEQKRKVEEERIRQKQDRHDLHNKNRNLNFMSLAKDANKRDTAFAAKEISNDNSMDETSSTMVDAVAIGQKDNSRKAYFKEFKKVIGNADVILEVLDARDPLGCRTKQIERMVIDSGLNKRIILILNKIDLVPRENTIQWLSYLRNEYPTIAFKSSTQNQRGNLGHLSGSSTSVPENILHSNECLGADTLIKLLKNYCRNANIKTSITVGVIGYPNVGKSSVINSLKRSKVCGVGAAPGFTKTAQEIHLDKNIKLLDCPGIVFSRAQWGDNYAEILLRNCVKIELLDDPIKPVDMIVSRCNREQLAKKYDITMFNDTNDFLILVARQRGRLKKGGIPDLKAAAKSVLQDWNSGKIPFYTSPPAEFKKFSDNSEIVSSWGKEFNVDELTTEDKTILESIKDKGEFGSSALAMAGRELPEAEMDIFDDDQETEEETDSMIMEDDDAPQAVPIRQEHQPSAPIVLPIKSSTVTFATNIKSKTQQILSPLEIELNPQHGKKLKQAAKLARKNKKKAAAVAISNIFDEEMAETTDNAINNDDYDFSQYFQK
ncbi:10035_t:CDS:2 [Ambispora leptoticha]|uniref:10035_t:CDS:1 n=1 Tax=Ambispora leptoticha TaxID=144679 RepID=A0A9N8WC33_9GLOM|nr:10035_t:CDS:2 [Ambispora leptoticha]